ncbi:AmmeMemoRadiSam system radical SAM enzyme [Microgenomates group bacterium RBG_19FT_COMBO_39_10]|nr:MAG: AmmeMemoRadiSam system radical SAM enzyme [Microgenomates group bacterium RBG_19FT_COMBO_39_10]
MKKTLLAKPLKNKKVACFTCQRRCQVAPDQWGFCQTRINKKGTLYSVIYGVVSSVNLDPIEKKPVFHYKPGSPCLSLGTYGCNFKCQFCQNYEISHTNGASINLDNQKFLSPEEAIKMAKKSGAEGIAWTYNEPAIWLEYSLDGAKLAKKEKIYTCWVTNGYATKEAIDKIAPYLDIYRVDLKSFDDKLYKKLIGVPQAKGVFETTKYIHDQYPEIHLECVTNIIPTWNDSENNLKKIAHWIVKNLGKKTPWHVTRFFPYADLTNVPPTPAETLLKARKIGMKEGLEFVYIGNLPVDEEDDTFCPKCHNLAIRRTGYRTEILGVDKDGHCSDCGEDLNIKI